jgi:hypothetical protein
MPYFWEVVERYSSWSWSALENLLNLRKDDHTDEELSKHLPKHGPEWDNMPGSDEQELIALVRRWGRLRRAIRQRMGLDRMSQQPSSRTSSQEGQP